MIFQNKKHINKDLIYVLVIVFLVIITISTYFFLNSSEDNNVLLDVDRTKEEYSIQSLILFGSNEIELEYGETYQEPGFRAVSITGEILTENVIITPEYIDTTKPGAYYINYVIGNKKAERKVIVKEKKEEKNDSVLKLELLGSKTIILEVGEKYIEPGALATDTIDGDISKNISIEGNVDTTRPGTYILTYEIQNSSQDIEQIQRIIIVKESELNIEITKNINNTYTNDKVVIKIKVTGSNFSHVKYPNGVVSKENISTYEITKNGNYKFLIYDSNYNYVEKLININEIDKESPVGTCNLILENNKSTIQVNAKDDISEISKYEFFGDDKLIKSSTEASYITNIELKSAYVKVYDNATNYSKITCKVTSKKTEIIKNDYLEMHFIVTGYNDDAILIRTGKSTLLIDSGRSGSKDKVISYLKDLGIKTIDAIIGSHPHFNHIQTQGFVIQNFDIKKSFYSVDLNTCVKNNYCDSEDVKYVLDAINTYNIPLIVANPGEKYDVGDVSLYFLGPYKLNNTAKYRQNNNSSLMILKYKNNTFMFTGDADPDTFNLEKLKPFANSLNISLDIDVLKYPHHGNADLDNNLVKVMTPLYTIVPNYNYSSKFNSSGKSKIKNIGSKIYEIDKYKNIMLKSDGKEITVFTNVKASDYKR